jgi:hypothetical protein
MEEIESAMATTASQRPQFSALGLQTEGIQGIQGRYPEQNILLQE